jgi:hexosaminidase
MNSTSSSSTNARYGGFYTQEQIKDVVAFAEKHFVNIVPEIEMPG